MGYHLDDTRMSLADLAARLEGSDLIPSQQPLLKGLRTTTAALRKGGIASVADLRRELKKPSSLSVLAARSGIEEGLLVLLRRTVEGWFPKPPALSDFPRADRSAVEALGREGMKDARALFEAAASRGSRRTLAARTGASLSALDELAGLADLSRIQWVSPGFARLLHDAGYTHAAAVAAADPTRLHSAIITKNADGRPYHGTIGRRDIARLVVLAKALPPEFEP